MNRQSKRVQAREERRGDVDEAKRRVDAPEPERPRDRDRERTPPAEYLREVRQELRKVAWPRRQEVTSYTVVVLVATAFLMAVVFAMDFVFGRAVFTLFGS